MNGDVSQIQRIRDQVQFFQNCFWICLAGMILFLILAVFFCIYFRIPGIIAERLGIKKRRALSRMENKDSKKTLPSSYRNSAAQNKLYEETELLKEEPFVMEKDIVLSDVRNRKNLFILVFTFLILSVQGVNAGNVASTAEKLEQASKGVVALELVYEDEEGQAHVMRRASGFFIGESDSAPQYILTSDKAVLLPEEQMGTVEEGKLSIRVVIKGDVTVGASVMQSSGEMGFALLNLSQPIYDREIMRLDNTMEEFYGPAEIYSIGIPDGTEEQRGEPQVSRGTLLGKEEKENFTAWIHDSYRNSGYVGGPLVSEDGAVLGINQTGADEETLYAVRITEILPVLDALGISYDTTAMEEEQRREEEAMMQTAMETVMAAGQGKAVGIEEKEKDWILIIAISGAILAAAAGIIALLLYMTKDKRAEKKRIKEEEMTVTQAPPVFSSKENGYQAAVLIRVKTGQREEINRESFVIGKERGSTDFYIGDNSAVSRMHACIEKRDNDFVLVCKRTTNGTFLNGTRLQPGEEQKLKNGDKMQLADEEFEFICQGGFA